ncbi:MAG: hypothetical protein CMK29_08380 [Porticoccaceae bacterium]|nr:hypothetical protein [Porticoccaceae bacterium]|tara:strand:+ start:95 stop:559 length:465 start_codon:yes stop_codon:yes gene_type:complete
MLLRMKLSDITKDGIYFPKRKKTGKGKTSFLPFIYNDECTGLKPIVDNIIRWRSNFLKVQSFYIFCSSYRKPMIAEDGTTSNFDSQWQRAKQKALKNGLTESFTEHDLRAKTASDLENLEHAAQLLQHTSSSTTQRIYRRKPDVVLPFKSKVSD